MKGVEILKGRRGSTASCSVGGADKNRLHYAVHLVNKWNNREACRVNAERKGTKPYWELSAASRVTVTWAHWLSNYLSRNTFSSAPFRHPALGTHPGARLTKRNFYELSDIRWRNTGLPRCQDRFLWIPWFWGRTAKKEPRTARRYFLTPCIRLILSTVSPPLPATLEKRGCCAFARCASRLSFTRRLQLSHSSRLPFLPSAPNTVTRRYPDSTPRLAA